MSKHTPGPWRHNDDRERSGRHEVLATERTVATIKWFDDQSVADARLIAAAPEMLEALKVAFGELQTNDTVGTRARMLMHAAIAKAEGRS